MVLRLSNSALVEAGGGSLCNQTAHSCNAYQEMLWRQGHEDENEDVSVVSKLSFSSGIISIQRERLKMLGIDQGREGGGFRVRYTWDRVYAFHHAK